MVIGGNGGGGETAPFIRATLGGTERIKQAPPTLEAGVLVGAAQNPGALYRGSGGEVDANALVLRPVPAAAPLWECRRGWSGVCQ